MKQTVKQVYQVISSGKNLHRVWFVCVKDRPAGVNTVYVSAQIITSGHNLCEDGGPVVVTGGHMITVSVAQSIHMNGRMDMWIIRAFQRSVLEDINQITHAN